jgi:glycine cleavage system H protein
MVALFVVLMVVAFLTLDLVLMARSQAGLKGAIARQREAEGRADAIVGGFALAADRSYAPGHTWARFRENATARVGIDDFAAHLVGPADAIEFPEEGRVVRAGEPIAVLRRRGREAKVLAPVGGIVVKINREAQQTPATVARNPYDGGWLCEIKARELRRDLRSLSFGDGARRFLDESASALHAMFAPGAAVPAAADGGRAVEAIADQMDDETWNRARAQFLG